MMVKERMEGQDDLSAQILQGIPGKIPNNGASGGTHNIHNQAEAPEGNGFGNHIEYEQDEQNAGDAHCPPAKPLFHRRSFPKPRDMANVEATL